MTLAHFHSFYINFFSFEFSICIRARSADHGLNAAPEITFLCQLYKQNIVEYYFSIDLSFILNMKNQVSPHTLYIFVTV